MVRRLGLALALALGACGPIGYVRDVRRASREVDDARDAGAATRSPYWYTLAVEYLRKAREEAGHADFGAAIRLGGQASRAAERALDESNAAIRQAAGEAPPTPAPPAPAPVPAPAPAADASGEAENPLPAKGTP
jgi:hypothetical protein